MGYTFCDTAEIDGTPENEHIDLYFRHRPDPDAEPEKAAGLSYGGGYSAVRRGGGAMDERWIMGRCLRYSEEAHR